VGILFSKNRGAAIMKIHEYQSKKLLKQYKIPVPDGGVAFSLDEAKEVADNIGSFPMVVKAQIHAGGRGDAGGVKIVKSGDELKTAAEEIIGMTLVNNQTGPEGRLVKKVLVEKAFNIERELYLGLVPDRTGAKIVIMASETGGMDIEEVAEKTPGKIVQVFIEPLLGIQDFHCREVAYGLNLIPSVQKEFCIMLKNLYGLFVEYDCSLLEINPLAITVDDKLAALDSKITIDDNAMFRHRELIEYRDIDEEDPLEVEASMFNLNYVKMDGNVGIMVNGAGLAMATMDVIKQAGAEPSNFLDVSGGGSAKMVENGFRIILSDENVKGILINVFGGIMRCDVLAEGVVKAAKRAEINVPVVIRMEGANVEEGRKILSESGLNLISAVDLKDAAQKVARLVKD